MKPTVAVCGFGRCGSTMTMSMLDAGGILPVLGSQQRSYEVPDISGLVHAPPELFDGRAVKLLDSVKHQGVPRAVSDWRFIWLDRDPAQQARSQIKLLATLAKMSLPPGAEKVLALSYGEDRAVLLPLLRTWGDVLVLSYERVLARPKKAAKMMAKLVVDIQPGFDVQAAAAAVHDRDAACRSDLAFEMGLT